MRVFSVLYNLKIKGDFLYLIIANKDPFKILEDNNGIIDNVELRETSAAFYSLIKACAVIGLLVAGGIIGLKLVNAKNPNDIVEAKNSLSFKLCIFALLFCIVVILGWIYNIAKSF